MGLALLCSHCSIAEHGECAGSARGLVPSQLWWLGDRSSPSLSSAGMQSSPCHLAGRASRAPSLWLGGTAQCVPVPCCDTMVLRPCWMGIPPRPRPPQGQDPHQGLVPEPLVIRMLLPHSQVLGQHRDAGASPPPNTLYPMRCQNPALPHCHGLPLATSLMRLPREHCVIITYFIIITAWGCPCPRGPLATCPPQRRQPLRPWASVTAARAQPALQPGVPARTSTSQVLGAPKQEQPCRFQKVWRCQRGSGDRRDLPPKACPGTAVPLPLCPSFPKSCSSPTKFRAWRWNEGKAQAGLDWGHLCRRGLAKLPQSPLSSSSLISAISPSSCHSSHQKALP